MSWLHDRTPASRPRYHRSAQASPTALRPVPSAGFPEAEPTLAAFPALLTRRARWMTSRLSPLRR